MVTNPFIILSMTTYFVRVPGRRVGRGSARQVFNFQQLEQLQDQVGRYCQQQAAAGAASSAYAVTEGERRSLR